MIGDNAGPLDGWEMPQRCCGDWFNGHDCPTCGKYVPPRLDGRGEN